MNITELQIASQKIKACIQGSTHEDGKDLLRALQCIARVRARHADMGIAGHVDLRRDRH